LLSVSCLSSDTPRLKYSFFCDKNFPSGIYSTKIKFSDGKDADVISWKKYPKPLTICFKVSKKLQEIHESNRLKSFSFKKNYRNQYIVCSLSKGEDACTESNEIFALLPGTNPNDAINGLGAVISESSNGPIYQGSDGELIVDFDDLIGKIRQGQEKKR
jgi:Circadian oscillating protein COP23